MMKKKKDKAIPPQPGERLSSWRLITITRILLVKAVLKGTKVIFVVTVLKGMVQPPMGAV